MPTTPVSLKGQPEPIVMKAYIRCNYVSSIRSYVLSSFFRWLCGYGANPGFTSEAFDYLKEQRKEEKGWLYRHCAVMIDGVKIRKYVEYDQSSKSQLGYVDFGGTVEKDDETLATEAIVLMAVGIHGNWKVTLDYFLIHSINSTVQAELISTAFELLHEAGVEGVSLTLDGHQTNLATAKKLGCSIKPDNIKHYFPHPSTGKEIYLFLDACHCLKLVHNQFCAMEEIVLPGEGVAKWSHLTSLNDFQKQHGLSAGNKLTDRHIQFEQQKMKLRNPLLYTNIILL